MKRYHAIQKLLALCLVFSMTLALLAGCAKKEQTPAGTISGFESQAHFQVDTSEGESATGDTSREPLSGEFVVSDKKYDYKDGNLVLLYVENQTNRHFNVTIKGKYLDENGETIEEETQTFEGFPSGWSNHFIFYPKTAFDSFTYELETKEYVPNLITADGDGNPFASYIDLTYQKKLYWMHGGNWMPSDAGPDDSPVSARALCFDYDLVNRHPNATISAEFHLIVLDAEGNVYATDYESMDSLLELGHESVEILSGTAAGPIGSEDNGKKSVDALIRFQEKGGDESIPENVQGVFTVIFAITDVVDYDRYMAQFK